MRGGLWGRFLVEAAFLVIVAVVLYVADVGWITIAVVMLIAWAIVSVGEIAISRRAAARASLPAARPPAALIDEPAAPERVRVVRREPDTPGWPERPPTPDPEPWPGRAGAQSVGPEAEPSPEAPEPAFEPEPWQEGEAIRIVARRRVDEPAPEADTGPEPALEVVAESAPPEQEPEAPASAPAEVQPPPAPAPRAPLAGLPPVAAIAGPPAPTAPVQPRQPPLPRIGADRPREWNLWELERLVRTGPDRDAATVEERSYLLMYLREFASPDGILPVDFDPLVRESFGDLIER